MSLSKDITKWLWWTEYFHSFLKVVVYILQILTELLRPPGNFAYNNEDLMMNDLMMNETRKLVKLKPEGRHQQSLLHIACSVIKYPRDLIPDHYPKLGVIKVLLEAGANPHTKDKLENTPLHVLDEHILSSGEETSKIFNYLLRAGIHPDTKNQAGKKFGSLGGRVAEQLIRDSFQYTTLQCLSARVIRKHDIDYSCLDKVLSKFVCLH